MHSYFSLLRINKENETPIHQLALLFHAKNWRVYKNGQIIPARSASDSDFCLTHSYKSKRSFLFAGFPHEIFATPFFAFWIKIPANLRIDIILSEDNHSSDKQKKETSPKEAHKISKTA